MLMQAVRQTGKTRKVAAVVLLALPLAACVIQEPPIAGDPRFAPVDVPSRLPPAPSNGSLYREGFQMQLFQDRMAHQVGDVITVVLQESTASKKTSTTKIKKENSVDVPTPKMLGDLNPLKNLNLDTSVDEKRDFNGKSDADQSNSLNGKITVTVAEVLPNGNLLVRGEKWMQLNNGDEFIRISGVVRPEDIAPDNSVQSARLANARIAYSGKGAFADSNRMGWLSRFFNSEYWPF